MYLITVCFSLIQTFIKDKETYKSRFQTFLTGLSIPQQYVCVALEELYPGLSVTLTLRDHEDAVDVTANHILLGYQPLVIALYLSEEIKFKTLNECCLNFHSGSFSATTNWEGFHTCDKAIARLILKKIKSHKVGGVDIIFFQGYFGQHKFLPRWQQYINNIKETFQRNKPGNITLGGNLHDQVRIAYAIPRVISLITLAKNESMNMFPTDLQGPIGEQYYVSSLRTGGKACLQVENSRKISLSDIEAADFKTAYALGVNHIRDVQPKGTFQLFTKSSKIFSNPLPASVLLYRELTVCSSFEVGIHTLFIYEVADRVMIKDGFRLAHIHQHYAQWRIDHGLPTKMLLR